MNSFNHGILRDSHLITLPSTRISQKTCTRGHVWTPEASSHGACCFRTCIRQFPELILRATFSTIFVNIQNWSLLPWFLGSTYRTLEGCWNAWYDWSHLLAGAGQGEEAGAWLALPHCLSPFLQWGGPSVSHFHRDHHDHQPGGTAGSANGDQAKKAKQGELCDQSPAEIFAEIIFLKYLSCVTKTLQDMNGAFNSNKKLK